MLQRLLTDQGRARGETIAVTDVEAARAGVETECETQIDDEEGMSIASVITDTTRRHERGTGDIIRDLHHDHAVVNGGGMATVSPKEETTLETGVAHLTGARSIDGAMTITIETTKDDEADVELGRVTSYASVKNP